MRILHVDNIKTDASQPIQRVFEEQVLSRPNYMAVVCEGEQLTYKELNERANQLAHRLQKLGVGPEVLVGICVERSLEMVIGILGVLKAGGAYVPLDPSYPRERLLFLLQDTRVPLLITKRRLLEKLPKHDAQTLLLDSDAELITRESRGNLASALAPENLAYVIYTSGSTGIPKGVMVTHGSVSRYVHSLQIRFEITSDDVYLHTASIAFSSSVRQLMLPLSQGATVVIATSDQIANPFSLFDLVKRTEVTIVDFVPSYWRNCIDTLLQLDTEPRLVLLQNRLRLILSASEPLSSDLPNVWTTQLKHPARVMNMFGQTETTGIVATYPIPAGDEEEIRIVPLGRAINDTEIRLLDERMQPVTVGVPGDLYIGGSGLARGYLNRPELTAEKFIADPFDSSGGRLYKTGDRGRYSPEGNFEFLGRLDHQVKVRGYRVELGEIERALSSHPAVRTNVVVMREDSPGEKRLVAYIVPKGTASPSVSDLRRGLKDTLPEYMIPAAFVLLTELPLTPTGKVDRMALPAPDRARSGLEGVFEPPRSPIEQEVARIWREVLDLEDISVHDNFLDLGGQSLLATRIISRLQRAFQTELTVRSLLENPTVATFSDHIQKEDRTDVKRLAPLLRRVREGELSLSFAQLRLWFLNQLDPSSAVYNIFEPWLLSGPLNITALRESFNEIVRRHEGLRTTFVAVDGRPVQVISPELEIGLELTDISSLTESEQDDQKLRLARAEASRPFNLAKGPLLRGSLLRLSAEKHVLLITTHHIVSDAWSSRIFMRELSELYDAFSAGERSPLSELPVQYADFAQWQRDCLESEVIDRHLSYWKRQLGDTPEVLNLPLDRPRPTIQTFRGAAQPFAVPKNLSNRLGKLSQRENVTMFMTLLTAFQVLLHHYTGQANIAVGSPIAGRSRTEVEQLIGFFVNTLVLRTDLSGNPTVRELLGRVREVALGAFDHQELPFERLVEEMRPERGTSQTPLVQVMLVLEDTPAKPITLSELTWTPLKHDAESVKFDLILYMTYSGSELTGSLAYNTDLFDAETIKRMVGHFQTLLEGIVADPDVRLGSLPFLTQAEERLRVERIETKVEFPRDKCLHELFEAQAVRTPNAIALVFEKQQLTYAELNARANQLAHYLIRLGVGPETLVGMCMERSLRMVISLLGILKAGGAYVPFEPTYPKERLAFMLQDTKTPVLLTEKSLVERIPSHQAKVICLDTDWNQIAQESTEDPVSGVMGGNLAYVIYTSGSTGTPKGVLVDHHNVVRLFEATDKWFHFDQKDVWTFFHSYAFDFSVWELWGALLYGGRLVLVPYWVSRSPEAFYELLCTEQVTILNQTPSAFRQLIQAEKSLPGPKGLALRFIIFGGEALELESLKPWFDCHPDQSPRLINMYGITETTVHVTYFPLSSDLRATGSPIGVKIPDLSVHILNSYMRPVPEKVAGEMFVGGAGLGRGYLNRPELTAERFIPNSFGNEEGGRLYKTGDLARYLPDGNLEYVGRADHQVKIRGFRIELGEIEAVLRQQPAVQDVSVVAREDAPGEKLLVAYIVPQSNSDLPREPGKYPQPEEALSTSDLIRELRSFLKERLPEYMVPSAFVLLAALPLTPNGKVDQRALPIPTNQRPVLETDYAEPKSGLEQTIAGIWQEVLNVERVGIHDNFFDLGGHSLLLTRAHAKLRTVLNREFPMITMFQYPTIDTLAKFLRPTSGAGKGALSDQREKLIDHKNRREQVFQKRKSVERTSKSK